MKKEFRVIVDHKRNGEDWIRDELTVCRWGEARNGGNCHDVNTWIKFSFVLFNYLFYI